MAIDAYVGLPGHGKSYGVVEHVIIPSLKQGRHVVTNIPLDIDALLMDFGGTIQQLPDDWFELDDLGEYAVPGCVLILDELWRRWPSGMLTNQASIQDKSLLAEHRHRVDKQNRSMRIVLVTQDLAQIANWARMLVESTFRVSKKSKKFYVVSIYNGAVTGVRPPKTALLRQTSGRFKKEVYAYYSSATQSETGAVGDESTADGRSSILKSWGLWALAGIVLIGGTFGFVGLKSFFTKEIITPEISQTVEQSKQPTPASRASSAVFKDVISKPSEPLSSTLWRVAGYIRAPIKRSAITSEMLGINHVELTERVALFNGSRYRYVLMSQCNFFEGGIDIYCDIDGERITPWSGSGAVTTVFQPSNQQPTSYVVAEEPKKTRVTVIPHEPSPRSFPVN